MENEKSSKLFVPSIAGIGTQAELSNNITYKLLCHDPEEASIIEQKKLKASTQIPETKFSFKGTFIYF